MGPWKGLRVESGVMGTEKGRGQQAGLSDLSTELI